MKGEGFVFKTLDQYSSSRVVKSAAYRTEEAEQASEQSTGGSNVSVDKLGKSGKASSAAVKNEVVTLFSKVIKVSCQKALQCIYSPNHCNHPRPGAREQNSVS